MGEAKQTLLPCPFCGGAPSHGKTMDEDIWSHNTVPWMRVRCSECEIGTDYVCEGYEPSEVEAWNRRSGQLVERVKELEEALSKLAKSYERVMQLGAPPPDALKAARAALSKARPNTAEGESAAEDEGISREQWIDQAVRVYLIAGDTEDQALECAAYLWGELDMDDLADPYDAAMSDIEGRGPAPAGATNTKTHALLSMMIGLFLRAKEKIGYQPGSAIDKTVAEAVEHLKDWPYQEATTAQAAESLPAVWFEHSDWSFKALVIDTSPPSEGEKFLEEPDVQDESGLNKYYSRELVLDCIEDALASKAAPRPSAIAESAPAPVLLSDEELCQIEEPYLLNFRIPLGGQYDFARAVEKAVICKMGREPAPQGETNVQLEFASAPRPKTQAATAAAKEPSP